MEALALHTGTPTVHREDNTSCISIVEAKNLLLELNTLKFLYFFYKKMLTMVYLFQKMRSIVSCRQICAPNRVQVQLSVGVLNGWRDSDYIPKLIQKKINSWDYIWVCCEVKRLSIEHITRSHIDLNKVGFRGKMSLMQKKCHRWYYVNLLTYEYISYSQKGTLAIEVTTNIIDGIYRFFESIYLKYLNSLQYGGNLSLEYLKQNGTLCFQIRSRIIYIFTFFLVFQLRTRFLYFVSSHMW